MFLSARRKYIQKLILSVPEIVLGTENPKVCCLFCTHLRILAGFQQAHLEKRLQERCQNCKAQEILKLLFIIYSVKFSLLPIKAQLGIKLILFSVITEKDCRTYVVLHISTTYCSCGFFVFVGRTIICILLATGYWLTLLPTKIHKFIHLCCLLVIHMTPINILI